MPTPSNQRTYERIPFRQKVKVVSMGRMVAYAMAINLGMGGVLLKAASPLPVGRRLRLDIPVAGPGGLKGITAEGTVVRSGADGTAIQFLNPLELASGLTSLAAPPTGLGATLLAAYRAYFQVSRNPELAGCEQLLGVSKRTFRATFYTTFLSCITLSILPVWLFQSSIPPFPNWTKVVLSFVYGAFWLAVIQPALDLAVFRYLRHHPSARSSG
jgi:hypothetical protein